MIHLPVSSKSPMCGRAKITPRPLFMVSRARAASAPTLKRARATDSGRRQTRPQPAPNAVLLSRSRRVAITLPRLVPHPAWWPVLAVLVVWVVALAVWMVALAVSVFALGVSVVLAVWTGWVVLVTWWRELVAGLRAA